MSRSVEERARARRIRRWKRSVRAAAPFLCLSLLLATLMLSVGLIEYRPTAARPSLRDKPIALPDPTSSRGLRAPTMVSSHSVVDPELSRIEEPWAISPEEMMLEAKPFEPETLRPPSRPYALGSP